MPIKAYLGLTPQRRIEFDNKKNTGDGSMCFY